MSTRHLILVGLFAAAVAQAVYYYSKLPNPMASHFGANGAANGWSSPGQFFAIILLVEAACAISFLCTPLFSRLPVSMINMPNKDYWLAPERREQTMRRFGDSMLDFGIATQLMLLYGVQLAIQANLTDPPRLSDNIAWALAVYGLGTAVWTIHWMLSYRLPKA